MKMMIMKYLLMMTIGEMKNGKRIEIFFINYWRVFCSLVLISVFTKDGFLRGGVINGC